MQYGGTVRPRLTAEEVMEVLPEFKKQLEEYKVVIGGSPWAGYHLEVEDKDAPSDIDGVKIMIKGIDPPKTKLPIMKKKKKLSEVDE